MKIKAFGSSNPNWRGGDIEKVCVICETKFKVRRARDKTAKCCSVFCVNKWKQTLTGKSSPGWKGGQFTRKDGREVIYKPEHPYARLYGGGYIFRYRLVAEAALGRFLLPTEIVHHRNEIVSDDRQENLEVMTASEHMRLHALTRKRGSNGGDFA